MTYQNSNPNTPAPGAAQNQNENLVYEGFAVRNRKAPLVSRVLAYTTDIAIVSVIMYFVGIFLMTFMAVGGAGIISAIESMSGETGEQIGAVLFVLLIIFCVLAFLSVYSGYFIYNEYKKGTTLGKRIFGLRVVSADGGKLSLGQCVLRDLLRLIDCTLLLPGFLSIQLTADGKRLGDMVAGTQVVHSKAKERESQFTYVEPETFNYYYQVLNPKPVDIEDAKLYLTYAFGTFITPGQISSEIATYSAELAKRSLTVPPDMDLTQYDIELFFAEYCNQTIIDSKGS